MAIHRFGGSPAFARRVRLWFKGADGTNQRSGVMFKIIGAAVVYGFALFGLATYLEARSNKEESAAASTSGGSLHAVRS